MSSCQIHRPPVTTTDASSKLHCPGVVDRIPARDPARPIKGMKLAHDPSTDKKLSSTEKKTLKPQYKTFAGVRKLYYTIHDCEGGGTSSDFREMRRKIG